MSKLAGLINLSRYYLSFMNRDLIKAYLQSSSQNERDPQIHMEDAMQWICRAQEATSEDDGVSRSYSLIFNRYFKKKGWLASYPETTGYIIPTFFDYAKFSGNQDYYDRALRMAEWECKIQLQNGAVQGGTVDQPSTPAVFNTGQVIFGWLRTYQETKRVQFLEAAIRAGKFLANIQSGDGSWRQNLSDYAGDSSMKFYSYNTRTAWSLIALSQYDTTDNLFENAGIGNIGFTLAQQLENGWFKSNCLSKPSQPLLHTIAYCIRGILESGIILENETFIERARIAADALISAQKRDGSLAGRYDENWQPMVNWSCLTGNAQTAIIWGKLYERTHEAKYLEAMEKMNSFLKKVQLVNPTNRDIHGGIAGSFPVHGSYGQFEILNWAVKFFIDALLLEEQLKKGQQPTDHLQS